MQDAIDYNTDPKFWEYFDGMPSFDVNEDMGRTVVDMKRLLEEEEARVDKRLLEEHEWRLRQLEIKMQKLEGEL